MGWEWDGKDRVFVTFSINGFKHGIQMAMFKTSQMFEIILEESDQPRPAAKPTAVAIPHTAGQDLQPAPYEFDFGKFEGKTPEHIYQRER